MSKHNGINATRDVLKDQLVLAADAIIAERLRITARPSSDEHTPVVIAMISAALGFLAGSVL